MVEILNENQCVFDEEIKTMLDSLEEKWNTHPTTDELQRDIGFLRKDLKVLKDRKANLEEARNLSITVIKKLCTLSDNFLKLGTSKEIGLIPILCDIVYRSEVIGIRLKAVEILCDFSADENVKVALLEEDNFQPLIACMVEVVSDTSSFDVRMKAKALETLHHVIPVRKEILLSSNSDLLVTLVQALRNDSESLSSKNEELAAGSDKITILELDIENIKKRRISEIGLLLVASENEEVAKDFGSCQGQVGLIEVLVDIILTSVSTYREKDEEADLCLLKALELMLNMCNDLETMIVMGNKDFGLVTALMHVARLHENCGRNLAVSLLCSLAGSVDAASEMMTNEFISYFVNIVSDCVESQALETGEQCLNCLRRIARVEENRVVMVKPETYITTVNGNTLWSVLENVVNLEEGESDFIVAARDLMKLLAPVKADLEKSIAKPKKRKGSVQFSLEKESSSPTSSAHMKQLLCGSSQSSPEMIRDEEEISQKLSFGEIAGEESPNAEDDVDDGVEDAGEDYEVRPARPTESKPSTCTPRGLPFFGSGLSPWQYLGYTGKR